MSNQVETDLNILLNLSCFFSLQDCIAGETSTAGSSSCTQCPAGTKCANAGTATPTDCAAGTYAAAGSTTCTDCPIGSFCLSTQTTTPTVCDAGYYTSTVGKFILW